MENAILEIRAGEGGMDSKMFAKDMVRMYVAYADRIGCTVD